jgi:hypothetical protein
LDLTQVRDQWRALVDTVVINLRVSQNIGKFWSRCTIDGLSRSAQLHGVSSIFKKTTTEVVDVLCDMRI